MIKLTEYTQYGSIEVFVLKTMIHSMYRNGSATNITFENGGVCTVQETPEEILAMPDIVEGNKVIDWEQRRYEIAKHMLPQMFIDEPMYSAKNAVYYADALINKLKGCKK